MPRLSRKGHAGVKNLGLYARRRSAVSLPVEDKENVSLQLTHDHCPIDGRAGQIQHDDSTEYQATVHLASFVNIPATHDVTIGSLGSVSSLPPPNPNGKPVLGSDGKLMKKKVLMDDTWFADGRNQPLYFPPGHQHMGKFKGMAVILQERGIDANKLKAQCKGFKCKEGETDCCCCRILFNQPDFAHVPTLLETLCSHQQTQENSIVAIVDIDFLEKS